MAHFLVSILLRKQLSDLWLARQSTFINDSRGVTSFGYTLLLAIIMFAITVALYTSTLTTGKTFNTLASAFDTDALPNDNASGQIALETPSDGLTSHPQQNMQAGHRHLLRKIFLLSTVLCTAVWALYVLRRQRRCREEPAEQAELSAYMPAAQLHEFIEKRQQILRLLTKDVKRLFESRIRACHLMSMRIVSVKPSARQKQVLDLMAKHRIRHILVCDDENELLGVVSNRDFSNQAKNNVRAHELMTTNPTTVSPNTTINVAITMMTEKNISCLPVVENGRVKGVLTTTDLLLSLQCSLQLLMKVATNTELMKEVLDTLDVSPESN